MKKGELKQSDLDAVYRKLIMCGGRKHRNKKGELCYTLYFVGTKKERESLLRRLYQ